MTKRSKHTIFLLLMFALSILLICSCDEPYDPAVVPETEVFAPIDITDTDVTETYNMFEVRFADAYDRGDPGDTTKDFFLNTYRTYRVTEKELTNQNKLFAIFAPIKADEIKQTWAYEQIDEPTEDYDGRIYYLETEQVDQMAHELFGKDVKLTHEWPRSSLDKFIPSFNNGRYEWRDPTWGGDPVSWYFHVLISAEKSGNYLIIYDKYINGIPVDDDELGLFYGDSEFVNSIEIPDEYKRNDYLLDYEKKDEVVLKYGAPYKHTFKLAEDGTYFWVSSEPVEETDPNAVKDPEKIEETNSDPTEEQLPLTEIPIDIEDPAVVPETEVFSPIDIEDTVVTETYNMFKIRFTDAYDIGDANIDTDNYYFLNTYRTYRVTEKELANHNKLFAIFAPIQADEIKQTWAYEQIDEPTEDYDGCVYYLETEQVEQMARELFGKDVQLTHEWPLAPNDKILPSFNNGRYEWRDPNRGGEVAIRYFNVPISAEKSENYLVIYDKYINAKHRFDEEIAWFYGDSEFENSIEIPDEYKPNEFNDMELINFDQYDEVVLNFGASYKHTFKLAEDGTYYWVSSEPIDIE